MLMDRADWLVQMVKKNGWQTGVEVGVGGGQTTRRLLLAGVRLTAVDIVDKTKILPIDNNLTFLKMASVDAADLGGFYDFVFIDADHSYEAVRKDIEAWQSLTHFLCGHDYCLKWPGVIKAVDELLPNAILTHDNCWAVQY